MQRIISQAQSSGFPPFPIGSSLRVSDGSRALREQLQHEAPYLGAVWLDRAEMEEGVGRWRRITEVIDRSEFVMLV